MKKSRVDAFKRGHSKTAMYVVAHAIWQRSRGRNVSEWYKHERNPRKALVLALAELQSYEPRAGTHVAAAGEYIVNIAKASGAPFSIKFNDVLLTACPSDTVESIVSSYRKQDQAKQEAWRESPEYQFQKLIGAMKVKDLQRQVDNAMADLASLDFSDLSAVIRWLERVPDHTKVVVPHERIVLTFREYGFEPGVNTGDDFDENDPDNFARWLIGQALECLNGVRLGDGPLIHSIHSSFYCFAKEWHEKFSTASM